MGECVSVVTGVIETIAQWCAARLVHRDESLRAARPQLVSVCSRMCLLDGNHLIWIQHIQLRMQVCIFE